MFLRSHGSDFSCQEDDDSLRFRSSDWPMAR